MRGQEPAYGGFLPPGVAGHSHSLGLSFDLARARALLGEAGFPGGNGLPELELVHADFGFSLEFRREVEARWRSPWRELDVRVRHEWVNAGALSSGATEPVHGFEWGWVADYPDPDGMLGTFLESGIARPNDPEVKRLLALARSTRSRDERIELYRDIDRRLVSESVEVVPTGYDAWSLARRTWLDGLWATPTQLGSLEEVVVRRPS